VERVNEIKNRYIAKGWKLDTESPTLSFVSECGRWFDCYDTATSQFYRLDGNWVVNLVQTKKDVKQKEVLSKEMPLSEEDE